MLYAYLQENYALNEPIIVSDINIPGMTKNTIRQQIKRLTDNGKLNRFATGIYYMPAPSMFKSGSAPSLTQVIARKYMQTGQEVFGYLTGVAFANRVGITTQVPAGYEIVTNRATTEYKKTKLGRSSVVLRKPRTPVNASNVKALQFLDMMKEVDLLSECTNDELAQRIRDYMCRSSLSFKELQPYMSLYPDKLYRNMYETGLLNGISA